MYAVNRLLLLYGGGVSTSIHGNSGSGDGGGAHTNYRNSAKLSDAFHTVYQRSNWVFDHVLIDVPSLVNSVAHLTRDLVGHERDRETVKIVQRQFQTIVQRRIPPRKSLALLFDGSEPLWQLERTRLFPGRRYDSKFYRSCASPMSYLLEEKMRFSALELRPPSPSETVISGPATPGLSEGKISAYLLDLATRIVQPPNYPPSLSQMVWATDSICIVGAPELALVGIGVTPFQNITSIAMQQGEMTCCSLQDTMEWLGMGHLMPSEDAASTPDEQQRLAAVRTDLVFLYLLTNGHNTTGLPQVLATPFSDVWAAYLELEEAFHNPKNNNIFRSFLFDEEPLTLHSHLDRSALRLRGSTFLKLLVHVYRNAMGESASVPSSSKPVPHAATLLTLALQTHGMFCSGGVPSPGWSPTPNSTTTNTSSSISSSSNNNGDSASVTRSSPLGGTALLDKYPKLSVEQLIQHLSYLTTSNSSASPQDVLVASSSSTTSIYLSPQRARNFGLTGAEVLLMTATHADHIQQLLPLYVRGHRLPDGVAEDIVSTRNVHEALRKTQQVLNRVTEQAEKDLVKMAAAENNTNHQSDNKSDEASKDKDNSLPAAEMGLKEPTEGVATCPHPALTHLPSHLFVRTMSSPGPPPGWAYYGVHLGVKAEAMNVRYTVN